MKFNVTNNATVGSLNLKCLYWLNTYLNIAVLICMLWLTNSVFFLSSFLVFEHSALEWSLILFSFLISHIMEDKVITPACENFDSVEKKSEFREVVEKYNFDFIINKIKVFTFWHYNTTQFLPILVMVNRKFDVRYLL